MTSIHTTRHQLYLRGSVSDLLPPISNQRIQQELQNTLQMWQSAGTSTFYAFNVQYQSIAQLYTLRNTEAVKHFLETHAFLLPLLLEIPPKIEAYFPHSKLFLSLDYDPESGDDSQLVVSIATHFVPKDTLRRLKLFDKDYWLDALNRANRKLDITVEFQ